MGHTIGALVTEHVAVGVVKHYELVGPVRRFPEAEFAQPTPKASGRERPLTTDSRTSSAGGHLLACRLQRTGEVLAQLG